MARPQSITDEEVLAAARAVFASKGVSATMEDVAERCHVGVATIFRRFPTKQALFTAATNLVNDGEWTRFLAKQAERRARGSAGAADAREGFIELAQTMLETARKMMPLIMMRLSNPSMLDRESAASRASWVLRSLAEHFEAEIAAGRMVEIDPRVAARTWLGAIRHLAMIEALGPSPDGLSSDEFIAGLAEMFCLPASKRRKR
jgi:AcrR family transcriptional regulator